MSHQLVLLQQEDEAQAGFIERWEADEDGWSRMVSDGDGKLVTGWLIVDG